MEPEAQKILKCFEKRGMKTGDFIDFPDIWLQLATLLFSLVLIFKNGKVEEIITRKGIESTPPQSSTDDSAPSV